MFQHHIHTHTQILYPTTRNYLCEKSDRYLRIFSFEISCKRNLVDSLLFIKSNILVLISIAFAIVFKIIIHRDTKQK